MSANEHFINGVKVKLSWSNTTRLVKEFDDDMFISNVSPRLHLQVS